MTTADAYIDQTISEILNHGYVDKNPRPKYTDGEPAYTLSVTHNMRKYDLSKNVFPITTLRPIAWKSAIKEILWIYQDQSNDLNLLRDKYNVHYWDSWESKDIPNTIGKRYGYIVKKYDLMNKLLDGLKNDPYGRRHIIDLYQYEELESSDGLSPCAFLTIWNVRKGLDKKEYLDMALIQRSGDLLAASCSGVNEIQYAALLMMVARHCGYHAGILTHFISNEQIYDRHIEQALELKIRYKRVLKKENEILAKQFYDDTELKKTYPKLILNSKKTNFYDFTIDDFTMKNYNPIMPQLKFEVGI